MVKQYLRNTTSPDNDYYPFIYQNIYKWAFILNHNLQSKPTLLKGPYIQAKANTKLNIHIIYTTRGWTMSRIILVSFLSFN